MEGGMGEGKEGRKVRLTSRKPLALCIVPVRYVLYVPDGSSQLLWVIQTWKRRRKKPKTCFLIEFKRLAWDGWMDGWMEEHRYRYPSKRGKILGWKKASKQGESQKPSFRSLFSGEDGIAFCLFACIFIYIHTYTRVSCYKVQRRRKKKNRVFACFLLPSFPD